MSSSRLILIAEDEPALRIILARCCQQAEFETDQAVEAAVLPRSTSYSLIITDDEMPEMNGEISEMHGVDFCRDVRSGTRNEQTSILNRVHP